MRQSTAYIRASGIDYTYRFCGVTAIEYSFALAVDADTSRGGDIINGARRQPNRIRLSVVETDAASQPGWSAGTLSAMDSIRRNRVLCTVRTSMGTWSRMLLSEITATQDEANQYGWTGDLVFTQYIPESEQYDTSGNRSAGGSAASRKTSDNSSTRKNTGTKAAAATVSSAAGLATVLSRAGVTGGTLYKT